MGFVLNFKKEQVVEQKRLESGVYAFEVIGVDKTRNKKNIGDVITVTSKVIEGPSKGLTYKQFINWEHQNPDATEMGLKQFSALIIAIKGRAVDIESSDDLIGGKFKGVLVNDPKDDGRLNLVKVAGIAADLKPSLSKPVVGGTSAKPAASAPAGGGRFGAVKRESEQPKVLEGELVDDDIPF